MHRSSTAYGATNTGESFTGEHLQVYHGAREAQAQGNILSKCLWEQKSLRQAHGDQKDGSVLRCVAIHPVQPYSPTCLLNRQRYYVSKS